LGISAGARGDVDLSEAKRSTVASKAGDFCHPARLQVSFCRQIVSPEEGVLSVMACFKQLDKMPMQPMPM
jgi:hypothetical protein